MAPGLAVAAESVRVAATANRAVVASPAPEVVRSTAAEWTRLVLAVAVGVTVPLLAAALLSR